MTSGHEWRLRQAGRLAPLGLLAFLAACGGGGSRPVVSNGAYPHYGAPGPADDPWSPYIREAASRYDVPERWIREVMRQESGGHEYLNGQLTTSDAGAMGLMQIMPATYGMLKERYGLGDDPYDPHDNILAGTAYIHELYSQYGAPGFLVAYNAGPQRLSDYLAGRSSLPNETVNYLASIGPRLGHEKPLTGPLAGFVHAAPEYEVASAATVRPYVPHAYVKQLPPGCWHDPDAAYDPDAPCQTPPAAAPAAPIIDVASAAPPPQAAGQATRAGSVLWGTAPPPRPFGVPAAPPPAPPPVEIASAAPVPRATVTPAASTGRRCWHDPDRAYDPDAPCEAPPAAAQTVVAQAAPAPAASVRPTRFAAAASAPSRCPHDPSRAFDPFAPCALHPVIETASAAPAPQPRPQPVQLAARTAPPRHGFSLIPAAYAATVPPIAAPGRWSVQLGAFTSRADAEAQASLARLRDPRDLGHARPAIGSAPPFGGRALYRARLAGLDASTAASACHALAAHAIACVAVPPGG